MSLWWASLYHYFYNLTHYKNIVQRWMCEHWIPIANLLHKSLSEYSRLSIIQNVVVGTLWWRNKTLQNDFLRVSKFRGRVSQLRSYRRCSSDWNLYYKRNWETLYSRSINVQIFQITVSKNYLKKYPFFKVIY